MNHDKPRRIELLAPARNAEIAIEAIKHGADAVYIGASSHGARAAAGNSVEDIACVVEYAHRFDAKVYVTLNTIIYDNEIAQVEALIRRLYTVGVDALIVQDMALLRMDIPPIALHASTQCDIRTADKARFLQDAGFSQLVLARELGIDEIRNICNSVSTPVEVFVHGALCVSYSGDCQAGYATMGRSANRGNCPQICRQSFDLFDSLGHKICADKHLLSLRDLNRLDSLESLLEAGVSSLKIEGRLKDMAYVKNVTAAYSRRLDEIIAASEGRYVRASSGRCELTFTPDLLKSFNRGYTTYFTYDRRPDISMASIDTPKWTGEPIGKVTACNQRFITAQLTAHPANGDGLGYFDASGKFQGFRLNRIEGNRLFPATTTIVPTGTQLFRNHDRLRNESLERSTVRRVIDLHLTLRLIDAGVALDVTDSRSRSVTVSTEISLDIAKTPQYQTRYDTLTRTGDTIYNIISVDDRLADRFIARSQLAALRRDAFDAYERMLRARYAFDYRKSGNTATPFVAGHLTYHHNIANRLARQFYLDHGVTSTEPALEIQQGDVASGTCVMTTRYCLRRELGICLRSKPQAGKSSPDLILQSGKIRLRAKFDCKECQMRLLLDK